METTDNQEFKKRPNSALESTLSSGRFRILLTTILADRMAYYGLRSIIVLYVVREFQLSEGEALSDYAYLTALVYISVLFGGFLSDLILGARNGLLVGFGLCVAGAVGIMIPDPVIFYAGAVFIALGTGFVRPSTFSIIGHDTDISNSELLEKRFISMYTVINLGAFLGA